MSERKAVPYQSTPHTSSVTRDVTVDCMCCDMFAARSGRRDRGGGGGSRGGGGSSRGQRGGAGRIGPMGRGGGLSSARPSQPSAMRSVVGSYTAPPAPSAGFTHGAHY